MRLAMCALKFLLLVVPLAAQAQGSRSLSLADARLRAEQTSPEILAARSALAAAVARERQAGAFHNPALAYGREQVSRDGVTSWQNLLTIEQPLEIGGARGARREAAALRRSVADARRAASTVAVLSRVTLSYASAVASGRRALLAESVALAFARAREQSAARLAGGDVSGYEHRRLQLEAARYDVMRLEGVVARDSALRDLATLVGLGDSVEVAASLRLTDTLFTLAALPPIDSLVAQAQRSRAELLVTVREAEASAAEARLVRAERMPIPSLSGGFKNEQVAGGETLNGFAAGVSVPIPLWDRRAGAVDAADAEAARRRAEAEQARRTTARAVRDAAAAYHSLVTGLGVLRDRLGPEADRARLAAESAYREGEIGLLEWLDSVRAFFEAERSYLTLWQELIARGASLERLTGSRLF